MSRRRAHLASIALTSNGMLLVNALSFLNGSQTKELRARLNASFGSGWFLGLPLSEQDTVKVIDRLDGAGAEAAARLPRRNQFPKGRVPKRQTGG